ncbi:MAG: metallophosphoesterase [Acidobacteria bacterium]|nr:metallophosphoesterase [Acidobacteriota bacterium]
MNVPEKPRIRASAIAAVLAAVALAWPAFRLQAADSAVRVVAVGDVHGDTDALAGILERAGLIDGNRTWTGGTATLVQTGDVMDRGTKVRAALDLLMSLEEQAAASGGRVVALLGNHETMNLIGEMRDVTPAIYATFADDKSDDRRLAAYQAYVDLLMARSAEIRARTNVYTLKSKEEWLATHPPGYLEYRESLEPEGKYGKWLRQRATVTQIGGTIFLHGGIHLDVAPKKLEEMNDRVRNELKAFDEFRRMMIDRRLILPFFTFQEMLEAAHVEYESAAARPHTNGSNGSSDRRGLASLDRQDLQTLQNVLSKVSTWWLIDPNGPLWYRGYAMASPDQELRRVAKVLDKYKATHLVVGHTVPSSMRITPRFTSRVFLIDTGMLSSVYPGGRASALEIVNGRYTAIYMDDRAVLTDSKDSSRDETGGRHETRPWPH